MTIPAHRMRLFQIILVMIFALPVLAHLYAGQFSRLLADDYCFGHVALSKGWWEAQLHWFYTWQGTFSSTAVQSAFALWGVSFISFLPVILLASWTLVTLWTLYQGSLFLGLQHPIFTSGLLGMLMMYGIVAGAPNIYQALYWTSGSVTYLLPLIIVTAYIGFLMWTVRRSLSGTSFRLALAFSLLITFAAAGFSPVIAALLGSFHVIGIGVCWFFGGTQLKRTVLPLLIAGLIGASIGLVLMVSAPGNAVRQSRFPAPPNLLLLTWIDLYVTISFTATSLLIFAPIPSIVLLFVVGFWVNKFQQLPLALAAKIKRYSARLLVLALGSGILLLLAIFLPSSYSLSDLPPERALLIPYLLLLLVIFSWGIIMGIGLQKTRPSNSSPLSITPATLAVLIILLLIGPLRSTWNTLHTANDLRMFAAEWDTNDQTLRDAANQQITEITLPKFTVDLATFVKVGAADEKVHQGTNACMEDYYGIDTIIVK